MSKTDHAQVILLLADGFEEAAAITILTTLRQAGLAVNLVGLRSNRVNGAHGLTIIPNTSLDQVLAALPPMLALVLPGGAAHLARLRIDPRVNTLVQHTLLEKAVLVSVENQATKLVTDLIEVNDVPYQVIEPEAGMYPEEFAHNLAQQLIGRRER
jgi:putative intracellular protease/amidase